MKVRATKPRSKLWISERTRGDVLIVALAGQLDISTAPELRPVLNRTDEAGERTDTVVDMTRVNLIDTDGLSVLTNASRRAVAAGRFVVVVTRAGPVRRLLELTGLVDTLMVCDSVSRAVNLTRSQAGSFRPSYVARVQPAGSGNDHRKPRPVVGSRRRTHVPIELTGQAQEPSTIRAGRLIDVR